MSKVKSSGNRVKYSGVFSGVYNAINVYRDVVQDARTKYEKRKAEIEKGYINEQKDRELAKAEETLQKAIEDNKRQAEKAVDREIASFRKAIREKAAFSPLSDRRMAELRMFSAIEDLTQAEFNVICGKYKDLNNYWDLRQLSGIAEKQGLKMPEGMEFANIQRQTEAVDEIERSAKFFLNGGSNDFLLGHDAPGVHEFAGFDGSEQNYWLNFSVSDDRFRDCESLYLTGFKELKPKQMVDSIFNGMLNRENPDHQVAYLENRLADVPQSIREAVYKKILSIDNAVLEGLISASSTLADTFIDFAEKNGKQINSLLQSAESETFKKGESGKLNREAIISEVRNLETLTEKMQYLSKLGLPADDISGIMMEAANDAGTVEEVQKDTEVGKRTI